MSPTATTQAKDNRGESVSEVQILPDGCARIHGRIDGKRVIDYKLGPVRAHIRAGAPLPPLEEGMDLIGLQAPVEKREPATLKSVKGDEAALLSRFVKAWLPDKQAYLLCFVDGFKHSLNEVCSAIPLPPFSRTRRVFAPRHHPPAECIFVLICILPFSTSLALPGAILCV
eukprot:scaffold182183_cov27-Tisochrysis_lutea.AAC.3